MRRTLPTGRRLATCGLTALAGLLLTIAAPAFAGEGVVRISDGKVSAPKAGIVQASHNEACVKADCCAPGACRPGGACCPSDECDGCGSGCKCGSNCGCANGCGKGGGLLGKLFGGGKNKNCRCGKNCNCGKNGHGSGLRLCGFGGGAGNAIGSGYCPRCGSHGLLYGPGYCANCCGVMGIPCIGIPVPCIGIPVPGCFAGANGGALAGTYGRVYALNPYYHDFRDGAVYAAQGYNAPMAVPLAPNVDYTMNYGWGMPASRMTPVSRVVPSPYAVQPTYAVPPGYVPAGTMAAPATDAGEADDRADEKK